MISPNKTTLQIKYCMIIDEREAGIWIWGYLWCEACSPPGGVLRSKFFSNKWEEYLKFHCTQSAMTNGGIPIKFHCQVQPIFWGWLSYRAVGERVKRTKEKNWTNTILNFGWQWWADDHLARALPRSCTLKFHPRSPSRLSLSWYWDLKLNGYRDVAISYLWSSSCGASGKMRKWLNCKIQMFRFFGLWWFWLSTSWLVLQVIRCSPETGVGNCSIISRQLLRTTGTGSAASELGVARSKLHALLNERELNYQEQFLNSAHLFDFRSVFYLFMILINFFKNTNIIFRPTRLTLLEPWSGAWNGLHKDEFGPEPSASQDKLSPFRGFTCLLTQTALHKAGEKTKWWLFTVSNACRPTVLQCFSKM